MLSHWKKKKKTVDQSESGWERVHHGLLAFIVRKLANSCRKNAPRRRKDWASFLSKIPSPCHFSSFGHNSQKRILVQALTDTVFRRRYLINQSCFLKNYCTCLRSPFCSWNQWRFGLRVTSLQYLPSNYEMNGIEKARIITPR